MAVAAAGLLIAAAAMVVVSGAPARALEHHHDATRSATVALGGDVILADAINSLVAERDNLFAELEALERADLSIVNLESAVAADGTLGVAKSAVAPFYFRTRPETLEALVAGGIDAVAVANNHSGDYGSEALLDQGRLLDEAGVGHAGSGSSLAEACVPIYLSAGNGLTVALLSADATEPHFAATADRAGTCHLPLDDEGEWEATFEPLLAEARDRAHAVVFAVHWGDDWVDETTDSKRMLGRRLIDLGVDVVLGSNAHVLQGLEVHGHGLIIHDAGHLVAPFDEGGDSAVFELKLTERGFQSLRIEPTIVEPSGPRPAEPDERRRILDGLAEQSATLDTTLENGWLSLVPPERAMPTRRPAHVPGGDLKPVEPAPSPPSGCRTEAVPEQARIDPVRIGEMTLVGAEVVTDHLYLPQLAWLDTYWTVEAPVGKNLWIAAHGTRDGSELELWMSEHEPCDWAWPTSRWTPGAIYRDRAALRPPPDALTPTGAAAVATGIGGPLEISVGIEHDGREVGRSPVLGEVRLGASASFGIPQVIGLAAMAVAIGAGIVVLRRRRRSAVGG